MALTAIEYFTAKLTYETDPADLAAARASGNAPLIIDVRSEASWDQGHIPGAVHVPTMRIAAEIADLAPDKDCEIVVYCWGPGCNGAPKAALILAELGYTAARELQGGFEYWVREGLAFLTAEGRTRRAPDPLTAPLR